MNQLQVFRNSEFGEIRSMVIDGEPWFVGRDVARTLGYCNLSDALVSHVDEEDKQVIQKSENATLEKIPNRGLIIINESGLYSLILSSKLAYAKDIKRWVTNEVLPSIRKTGKYAVQEKAPEKPKKLLCDVPENREAQRIMQEMKNLNASIGVLLDQYNCYRAEVDRKKFADVLISVCGRLYSQSFTLDSVKYKLVEKIW